MERIQPKPDRRNAAAREQLLGRLRAEFRDLPSLRLTAAQIERLLDLRPDVCQRVLATLVSEGTLCPDSSGQYVRCDEVVGSSAGQL